MEIRKSSIIQFPLVKKPLLWMYDSFIYIVDHTLPDKALLSLKFRINMHRKMHWNHPVSYSEKIQWLKLYGRTPENRIMSDKYLVKKYVEERIGANYVIPLIGVWDKPEEIDFESLPEKFVIKCNHNSGTGMFICKNKSQMDIHSICTELRKGLKEDYFIGSREYAYKDIPRKIIAEAYMEDEETKELRDYKFFCFDGEPKIMFIASGRSKGEHEVTFDFFDMDYNHLPFTNGHPNAKVPPQKPKCFEEMKHLAAELSKGIPHVRVDFYEANGKVYFGEFTFSHWGGMMPYEPEEWDYTMGNWIKLPVKKDESKER